jgi:BolA-like protein 3
MLIHPLTIAASRQPRSIYYIHRHIMQRSLISPLRRSSSLFQQSNSRSGTKVFTRNCSACGAQQGCWWSDRIIHSKTPKPLGDTHFNTRNPLRQRPVQTSYSTSTVVDSVPIPSENSGDVNATAGLKAPDHLDEAEAHIFQKLASEFAPSKLAVQDVSGGCGSMYSIEIASQAFKGKGVVQQHRMVNGALKEEVAGWHGVQLKTSVA